ncbi:LysR family transcriptional regulator [Cochlodiniinecator piscidefendens]|uniref:LysR family transcriptional regulator n=1 Tax=Cochlodiniinecator piscidefendens TaxID=2715756 RepID=UPI0014091F75|nr:LysR family transcriptional regulator [Cochlodiniinecator piscidefendens]
MEHTDYHIFKLVVEAGSFASAAEIIGKTPSGLSRRLTRLEDRIGQSLITRTTRRLTLTDKGEAFLLHCNKLIKDMAQAEAEIASPDIELSGVLKIKTIAAYATRGLLPILHGFQEAYPRIIPWLVSEGAGDRTEADIIISSVDVSTGPDCLILEQNPWVVCAAPAYLEKHCAPQTPSDLELHDCLVLDIAGKAQRRWRFHMQGKVTDVQVDPALIGFGDTIHSAALNGQGIARLASFLVRQDIEQGDLVPVLTQFETKGSRAICAMPGKNVAHLAKVRAFIEFASRFSHD